jgi:CRISPR-associated protein Csb1
MTTIATEHRWLFEAELKPVIGDRFQPTGFPDLGHAVYDIPSQDGQSTRRAILVESAQSMANRLESVGWDPVAQGPVDTLQGLPYIQVVHADNGEYLTSSRTEAHRVASAFVKDSTLDGEPMRDVIKKRLGLRDDRPISAHQIARAVFDLDPLCLVHGVFFAEDAKTWPGQPKIARALTAFIEAFDVEPAHSGGVKRDHVRHSHAEGGTSTEGYGSIPYHRTEWTAGRIVARFAIDRAQIRSYGLDDGRTSLLEAIALWEIRSVLDVGMRLRTACDLVPGEAVQSDQAGQPLPGLAHVANRIQDLIAELGRVEPMTVRWTAPKAARKKVVKETGEETEEDTEG